MFVESSSEPAAVRSASSTAATSTRVRPSAPNGAASRAWPRRVRAPAAVPKAKAPVPSVSSHSSSKARSGLRQTSGPKTREECTDRVGLEGEHRLDLAALLLHQALLEVFERSAGRNERADHVGEA